jgi:hypothetical protein
LNLPSFGASFEQFKPEAKQEKNKQEKQTQI